MQFTLPSARSRVYWRWSWQSGRRKPRPAAVRRPVATAKKTEAARSAEKLSVQSVKNESNFKGLTTLLDSVKWPEKQQLIPVIVQHVDTGELLMQAYADRAALSETLQTNLATFYSRSRKSRWCKGETSGNYIHVTGIYIDCDRDSIIYLGDPIGPSCHTGARTCWFTEYLLRDDDRAQERSDQPTAQHSPQTTLLRLETTIEERRQEAKESSGSGKSWTAKLMNDPALLCSKIVEEAQELCDSMTKDEGKERTAEEMADVLYHSMVLLNAQGVSMEDVLKVLRRRFGTSGIEEKASRSQK